MEVIVTSYVSVDGITRSPGHADEDREGGFDHGGWIALYAGDTLAAKFVDWVDQGDTLLLGRKTYEIFAAFWSTVGDEDPVATGSTPCPSTSLPTP